jgi:hypothetical protein
MYRSLYENEIGDKGAEAIAHAMRTNVCITSLDLSYNRIGNFGFRAIAEMFRDNHVLSDLRLRGNTAHHDGVAALAGVFRFHVNIYSLHERFCVAGCVLKNFNTTQHIDPAVTYSYGSLSLILYQWINYVCALCVSLHTCVWIACTVR